MAHVETSELHLPAMLALVLHNPYHNNVSTASRTIRVFSSLPGERLIFTIPSLISVLAANRGYKYDRKTAWKTSREL